MDDKISDKITVLHSNAHIIHCMNMAINNLDMTIHSEP